MSDQDSEDLFQGFSQDDLNLEASNELRSSLITSYERAIHNGLAPCRALAVILEWMAEECARTRAEAA